ncbi:hypothetical protein ACH6CV_09015 [Bacillota bacterium Meth-B3]
MNGNSQQIKSQALNGLWREGISERRGRKRNKTNKLPPCAPSGGYQ